MQDPALPSPRPLRFVIFVMVLVVMVASTACRRPRPAALPRGSRVLALGDSLTAGHGVQPAEAWPTLLAARTGWEVVNGGVSGDTSQGGLQRLPGLLERHHPALVLVALGGNDMLRQVPSSDTVANLERIVDLAVAGGARVVLLATPQPSVSGAIFRSLSAPGFYRELAERRQVPVIEEALPEVLSAPDLKVDPLHPNGRGHAVLAGKLESALRELGLAP